MGQVDDIFGAWYIGEQVTLILYGLSILQAWLFFQRWREEAVYLKFMVLMFMIGETVHVVLLSHGLYHFLVSSIGNPAGLTEIPWSFKAGPFLSSILILTTIFFYAFRIFILYRSFLLLGIIVILALASFVTGLIASIFELSLTGKLVPFEISKNLAVTALACDVVVDFVIMVAMFYFLRTHRTGTRLTDQLLNTLIVYTLATGFLTCIASALILALFITKPQTQIYSGASFGLAHLYTNSLLSVLNARRFLREKRSPVIPQPRRDFSNIVFHQPSAPTNTTSTGTETKSPMSHISSSITEPTTNEYRYHHSQPIEDVGLCEHTQSISSPGNCRVNEPII